MDRVNVELFKIYGGIALLVLTCIILALIVNDLLRRRMIFACSTLLIDSHEISKVSMDEKTERYLMKHRNHKLYRINESIEKRDNVLKYQLCLEKRAFEFYLKKRNIWNYDVVAVKMDR
ncbi:hypothetical protein M5C72_12105 [Companilactobacillus allii]|uniref:Uncharacterized protein n=1 Tax=Companilactobacillus allii TaxID=1847728 RepID=A0A1P8Q0Y6_9LACO|nr:hypothetical protein [Companilactobacillus allii]APX71487.1 hypothetical protein BTM29_02465 [Companilactobacillus allii]USQ68568.1 hypothetical protein M5C72_12105 [Companilactobacillus allii]